MIEIRWVMMVTVALIGAVMLVLPHLSPRGIFFGVRTGKAFRGSEAGRTALAWYRVCVVLVTVSGAVLVSVAGHSAAALVAGSMGPQVVALAAFVRNHFLLKPHAQPALRVREAELDPGDERLPLWAALAAPPFVLPVAAMLYLRDNWSRIPERYPVHFGINGEPDRWAKRTERAVYAPLWFGMGLMALMLLLGIAMLLGSRKNARRMGMPQVFVAILYLMSGIFTVIGIGPLVHVSPLAIVLTVAVFVLSILIYGARMMSRVEAPVESTPDEYWTLGGIYYNPNDPALFVQKRIGYGFTVNFANRWSWVVLGGFFLGVAALTGYLVWAQR